MPASNGSSTRRSCAAWTTTRARCSSSSRPTSAPRAAWAAAGAGRMLLAAEPVQERVQVDLFVAYAKPQYAREALRLATAARRGGLHAEVELAGRSLKGQLKQADRVGARYVALLGDEGAQ